MAETFTFDNLLIGDDFITDTEIMASGQNLKRGTALGQITVSRQLAVLDSTANDGSQIPFAILAADCDASAAAKSCAIYVYGEFNSGAMTFHGADTASTFKKGFRDTGIYLKTTIAK